MKYEPIERLWIDCDHQGCIDKAIIQKNKKNYCLEHYRSEHLDVAQKWCHENGLDSEEKRKEYCFKNQFQFKRVA